MSLLMMASHSTNIQIYPPNPFHLFFNLSICYWVGIFLLILLMLIRIRFVEEISERIIILDIVFLFTLTCYYSITAFIYPTIRYVDSYILFWDLLNPIISEGQFNLLLNHSSMYFIYFNASTIFFSYIFQFNSDPHIISNYFPIIVIFLGAFVTYILALNYSKKYAIIGGIIFIIFNWSVPHLAPQDFAYISLFFIIYLVYTLLNRDTKNSFFLLLLFLTTTIFSHLLSNFILLYFLIGMFFVLSLIQMFPKKISFFSEPFTIYYPKKAQLIIVTSFLGTTFLAYLIGIELYFEKTVNMVDTILNSFFENEGITLVHRTVVNTTPDFLYQLVYIMRMGVLFLFLFLIIFFSILILYEYFKTPLTLKMPSYVFLTLITLFLLFSFGGILIITGNSTYGFDRAFPLSLIPFGILTTIIFLLNDKLSAYLNMIKSCVILIIILLILILPITNYGSDPYHFFSESEDKANQFGFNHIENFKLTLYDEKTYSNMMYNYKTLKERQGLQYLNKFNNRVLNKIYDVGNACKIYN